MMLSPSYSAAANEYRLTFAWTRPVSEDCGPAARGITLEQAVTLVPGRQVVVEGDAGLRVELEVE